MIKRHWLIIALTLLMAIGFLFRIKGLAADYSFWTDEGHVAIFARAILERGKPVLANGYSTGTYQWLWYWLTAFSMKVFGINEFGARFPSVIFGVLTIPAVYLVARGFFTTSEMEGALHPRGGVAPQSDVAGKSDLPPAAHPGGGLNTSGVVVGLVAALLTTFLRIEVLWSRQARPYQAIQFFYLLETWLFLRIIKRLEAKKFPGLLLLLLILSIITSSLMHWFGLLPVVFFGLYFLLFRFDLAKNLFQKMGRLAVFMTGLAIIFVLYRLKFFFAVKKFLFPVSSGKIGFFNHIGYYHSFLWRQYGLLIFLAFIGLIVALSKNFKKNLLILVVMGVVFGLVNFRLEVPFARYLYSIFPFLIILAAYGLDQIAVTLNCFWPKKLPSSFKNWTVFFLAAFIIFNGYKFTFRPRLSYSLNEDMQEIPEVDFKGIYQFIKEKTAGVDDWVLITTWCDHATWYLGENKPDYWLRVKDPRVLADLEKDVLTGALVLGSLEELEETIVKEPQGFIILESWEPFVPEGAREYVRQNLKKELEVDRIYPIQPRYWPVEVYSWGL